MLGAPRSALALAAATIAIVFGTVVDAACRADMLTVHGDFGQARFSVIVADEPETRARGLMFVEEMPKMAGMLFVYDAPQRATFWMRNTLIPLDMLFADPQGVIRHIHEMAIPLDETTIDGGEGILFVLEINGGLAHRLGIAPGDVLQHPAIGPDAARPCD
ncbi:MAG: DUF192 domain-containing protein [Rubellimicrobium sp.]|nr:DUF192 domain-containing protein [Rubellimicrobium sp.]